jgi:hypothetical protein
MKAAIFYILLLCFGLPAGHNSAPATVHNDKLSFSGIHNTVQKQQLEANSFIDVEDENDDKDITKKLPQQSKWILIAVVKGVCIDVRNLAANNLSDNSLLDLTGAQICIEHRVLRI